MTEDSNADSEDMCLADSPSSSHTNTDNGVPSGGSALTSPNNNSTTQIEGEGNLSSLDLVGVDISQIEINSQRSSIRCRWVKCGQWFPHLEMLATHVTHTHAVAGHNGLFYCGWDGCSRGLRGFNARYKMLVHVRTHTNEKPHHCFQCDKSFSRAENLKIHARSHTGERPYVCPVPGCGKAYSNSSDRFKHTRTHSVDKPYVCKVPGCPKRYTDPSSLRKHVKTFRHFTVPAAAVIQHPMSPNTGNSHELHNIMKPVEIGSHEHLVKSMRSPVEMSALPTTLIIPSPIQMIHEDPKSCMTAAEISPPRLQHPHPESMAAKYLPTPGSQPFPAWPGFLQPWYDNVMPWSDSWRPNHSYHPTDSFVMDVYNLNDNRHQPISSVVALGDEEQDRPLDLTVQAK